jgi:hypothetical protein
MCPAKFCNGPAVCCLPVCLDALPARECKCVACPPLLVRPVLSNEVWPRVTERGCSFGSHHCNSASMHVLGIMLISCPPTHSARRGSAQGQSSKTSRGQAKPCSSVRECSLSCAIKKQLQVPKGKAAFKCGFIIAFNSSRRTRRRLGRHEEQQFAARGGRPAGSQQGTPQWGRGGSYRGDPASQRELLACSLVHSCFYGKKTRKRGEGAQYTPHDLMRPYEGQPPLSGQHRPAAEAAALPLS